MSLCSPGWPGILYAAQTHLKFRDLPASGSQELELKISTTMPGMIINISEREGRHQMDKNLELEGRQSRPRC